MSNPIVPGIGCAADAAGMRHPLATIEGVHDFSFAATYPGSGTVAAR
ncbi:hypothetical protein [Nocardia sp. alder85J]|nr:hypothetical protein [Nocardia sp. alder85J]MCX4097219.1 hypothetical protein [Nocardia sp. alder85J]